MARARPALRSTSRRIRIGVAAPFAILLSVAALPTAFAKSPDGTIVQTRSGPVRGATLDGAAVFRGVPFAAPPVGALRWKAPAQVTAWAAVRDAGAFGPDCIQASSGADQTPQSEDCLTLNVATPDPGAKGLPVLVSIHGGAFFRGSGREIFKSGVPPIVRNGVVVVAPNYRLGRLGFFAHPALSAEAPRETANYWLMDQVAALEWVRDNIARFGGDPRNVTILGCSAGGSSVNALLASPKARGLFARAGVHSGGGFFNASRPLPLAEDQGLAFAGRVGVARRGADALNRLRALTAAEVLAGDTGAPDFGAVVDGAWLPSPVSIAFARGRFAHVPLMTGSTSNEASVFGLMGFDKATLETRFGIQFAPLAAAYGPLGEAEMLRQVQTDFIFTSASMGMTQLAARAGVPVWSYHFDYVNTARRGTVPGAAHCEDMAYWLGVPKDPSPEDLAVARTMQAYLLNFVRTGDPNGPALPAWPRTAPAVVQPLLITGRFEPTPGFRAPQLAPWYAKWEAETGETLGFGSR